MYPILHTRYKPLKFIVIIVNNDRCKLHRSLFLSNSPAFVVFLLPPLLTAVAVMPCIGLWLAELATKQCLRFFGFMYLHGDSYKALAHRAKGFNPTRHLGDVVASSHLAEHPTLAHSCRHGRGRAWGWHWWPGRWGVPFTLRATNTGTFSSPEEEEEELLP